MRILYHEEYEKLDPVILEQGHRAGWGMTLDEAVDYALAGLATTPVAERQAGSAT